MEEFNIKVTDSETLKLLEFYESDKRDVVASKALRIGLIALKDMESAGNVDYVEKEFEKFKVGMNKQLEALQKDFVGKLSEADKLIEEKLNSHFNPDDGIMNKVLNRYLGEGGTLCDLFDENNKISAVSKIRKIMADYFDEDASKIVRMLDANNEQSPLYSFKKELTERLIAIQGEVKAAQTAKAAVKVEAQRGTQKGIEYQDFVFAELEKIAQILGDTCIPTGNQSGQVLNDKRGDFVIKMNVSQTGGAELKIVIEAKDKEMYLNGLLEELDGAMKNRNAGISIAVMNSKDIIKDVNSNIGIFRDYANKIICVLNKDEIDTSAVEVAYKLARAKLLLNLKVKEMKSDSVDVVAANNLIDEINKKLATFTYIKSTLTKANNAIGEANNQIDNLKSELNEKLDDLAVTLKPAS